MSWLITGTQKFKGLLDEFTGSAAAYGLRDLTFLRGGPVVRVRRSSDNTEADFTATQVSDGSLVTWVGAGNNGFVRTWYDQSGNGRHAEQVSTASQPIIVSSGSLVSGGLSFNGTSSHLIADSLSGVFSGASVPLSYFGVSQTAVAATLQTVVNGRSSSAANPIQAPFAYRGTGSNYFQQRRSDGGSISNNGSGSYASVLNTNHLITSLMGTGELRANGTQLLLTPLTFGQVTVDRVTIGADRQTSAATYLNGKIAEMLLYPTDQSANKVAIEANINAHYAIY